MSVSPSLLLVRWRRQRKECLARLAPHGFVQHEICFYVGLCASCGTWVWIAGRHHETLVAGLFACVGALILSVAAWSLLWALPLKTLHSYRLLDNSSQTAKWAKPLVATWPLFVPMLAFLCSAEALRAPSNTPGMLDLVRKATGSLGGIGALLIAIAAFWTTESEMTLFLVCMAISVVNFVVAVVYCTICMYSATNTSGCIGSNSTYVVPLGFSGVLLLGLLACLTWTVLRMQH